MFEYLRYIIFNLKIYDQSTPFYKQLRWLKFKERMEYNVLEKSAQNNLNKKL